MSVSAAAAPAATPTLVWTMANQMLRAFLSEIKLEKHLESMERAGYDDVDDFKNFNAQSLETLRAAPVD